MTNIINLPNKGNRPVQRAAHRRLTTALDERVAMQNFAVRRQQYYADPNTENEAYQAVHGSVA